MTSPSPPSLVTRTLTSIFTPPFRGLPYAIWAYFVLCFGLNPHSSVLTGNLPDADDYMYLAHVLDWFSGQSWYDTIQHRLDPSAQVHIDFTRVTELPMAGLIALLNPIFGKITASLLMAGLIPPLLFAVLLLTLSKTADLVINPRYSRATCYVALFATYLIYQFSPGHIDHHGLTALLVLAGFTFTARMIFSPENWRWPLCAGLVLSLALVVGLEVLPPLCVLSSSIGLRAMIKGGKSARGALIYGLSLFISSAGFLTLITRPRDWFLPDQLGYSIVYVIFTASLALCFSGIALAAKTRFAFSRYFAGTVLALITGSFFLTTFPDLIRGPYGAMNADLAAFMFKNIPEAIAIITPNTSLIEIFLRLLWPMMGLGACVWLFRRSPTIDARWFWGLATLCLVIHLGLATLYQIRFMVLAQLFSILPLTAILPPIFDWLAHNSEGRSRFILEFEVLLLIAPLPMVIFPVALNNGHFTTDLLLFPVEEAEYACDMQSLAKELNQPQTLGAHPHVIMNGMSSGPELLFRTQDIVLSAPFHTNVTGNLDSINFFTSPDPTQSEMILRQRNSDLVVLCRNTISLYSPKDKTAPSSLAQQLDKGIIPPWLVPLHYKDEKDYMLFQLATPGNK